MTRHRFTVELNNLEHEKLLRICEVENLSKTKVIAKLIKNKRIQDITSED